jgi:hypothetical protein
MGSLEPFKKDRPFSLFVARQRVEWAQYLAKQPRPDHNILLRGLVPDMRLGTYGCMSCIQACDRLPLT